MTEEHEAHEVHSDGLVNVLTDPAHLGAEFIFEGFFLLVSVIYVKIKLRSRDREHRHDRKHRTVGTSSI